MNAPEEVRERSSQRSVLLLEPFYGGSHKQLMDLICSLFGCDEALLLTLPDKKWPWRARCSALYFSEAVPARHSFKVILASSVLNMAELLALRPDLASCKKCLYFHENQLHYPVQWWKDRDFQFGYNQIISCLVADEVLFNSAFNMESFLVSIDRFLKLMPDHRPKGIAERLRPKCRVLYYPIDLSALGEPRGVSGPGSGPLHVVWPHRWEHDKDPDTFFGVLFELQADGLQFCVSVLGQAYAETPPIFAEAKDRLASRVVHWGYCQSKSDYVNVLRQADVAVSTARHEFFGVAMLEASYLGCFPLCPNRLVYPEIFPSDCLYNTSAQLRKKLRHFCRNPNSARNGVLNLSETTDLHCT